MTLTHKTLAVAGLLLCGLIRPQASYATSGCTNGQLTGTYNAQVTSAGFQSILNALNTTGTAGKSPSVQGGFGSNTNSLSGSMLGLGRYFFDGNGNIDGVAPGGNGLATIGAYTVNSDCSATMKLMSGQTYNAVLANAGARVLFIETDANGAGTTGELNLSTNACLDGPSRTFAFSFFGAQQVSASTSGTGTGTSDSMSSIFSGSAGSGLSAHASVPASVGFQATSGVGSLTLDGQGGFSLTEWVFSSGSTKQLAATGSYTMAANCTLQLKFSTPTGASTGNAASNNFQGILLGSQTGLAAIQTDQSSDFVLGPLISQ